MIRTLATPVSVQADGDKVTGVTFRRNVLKREPGQDKPTMVPVPDSEFDIPCRHLIVAIGQSQEWEILPEGIELTEGFRTSKAHVFATGDFATGSDNVIKAVANGKQVAEDMDAFLMGKRRMETFVKVDTLDQDGYTGRVRDHDLQNQGQMSMI